MELNWTKEKPTKPGAYWVRGYAFGRPAETALVTVRHIDGGGLCSDLHECNSATDDKSWRPICSHNDKFEWCGPLVPHNTPS